MFQTGLTCFGPGGSSGIKIPRRIPRKLESSFSNGIVIDNDHIQLWSWFSKKLNCKTIELRSEPCCLIGSLLTNYRIQLWISFFIQSWLNNDYAQPWSLWGGYVLVQSQLSQNHFVSSGLNFLSESWNTNKFPVMLIFWFYRKWTIKCRSWAHFLTESEWTVINFALKLRFWLQLCESPCG